MLPINSDLNRMFAYFVVLSIGDLYVQNSFVLYEQEGFDILAWECQGRSQRSFFRLLRSSSG